MEFGSLPLSLSVNELPDPPILVKNSNSCSLSGMASLTMVMLPSCGMGVPSVLSSSGQTVWLSDSKAPVVPDSSRNFKDTIFESSSVAKMLTKAKYSSAVRPDLRNARVRVAVGAHPVTGARAGPSKCARVQDGLRAETSALAAVSPSSTSRPCCSRPRRSTRSRSNRPAATESACSFLQSR